MISMGGLSAFRKFSDALPETGQLMPVLFVGHGSPMNGIEDNEFSLRWERLGRELPVPAAVLVISAHWFVRGTRVTAMDFPKTIHDFGGFPQALFDVQYPAPGSPALAQELTEAIRTAHVTPDHDWGLDHGAWSIVKRMYPDAGIPVLQLSIDYTKGPQYHYDLAKELFFLRKKGVLIIGSGNMVHNLGMVNWQMMDGGGYDWAYGMNDRFKQLILNGDHRPLIQYETLGSEARMAIPTPEHYLPLLYSLALQDEKDDVSLFNDKAVGGSLTMTSVQIGRG